MKSYRCLILVLISAWLVAGFSNARGADIKIWVVEGNVQSRVNGEWIAAIAGQGLMAGDQIKVFPGRSVVVARRDDIGKPFATAIMIDNSKAKDMLVEVGALLGAGAIRGRKIEMKLAPGAKATYVHTQNNFQIAALID